MCVIVEKHTFFYISAKEEVMNETSKNERAAKVFGMRADRIGNAIIFDQPCELGYHCPVCIYEHPEDNFDERLLWSEYNSFLWCEACNKDYPSALCMPDIDRAIGIFLDSAEDLRNTQEQT